MTNNITNNFQYLITISFKSNQKFILFIIILFISHQKLNFYYLKDTMLSNQAYVSKDAKLLEPLMYDGGDSDAYRSFQSQLSSFSRGLKGLENNTWAYHMTLVQRNATITNLNQKGVFYLDSRKGVELSDTSLFFFNNTSWLRYILVMIVHQAWFNNLILLVILINSILLGMKDYTDLENVSRRNQVLEKFDPYINAIIYLECIMKIIAMGFLFGKNSYLKNGWNVLDFIVVLGSLLETVAQVFASHSSDGIKASRAFRALRAIRILRPLRLIGKIEILRGIVTTLINSIAALQATFGLLCFIFVVYSIFGMTIWDGAIHYRCYTTENPIEGTWILYGAPDNTYTDICSDNSPCPGGSFCRNRFLEKDPDNSDAPYPFTDSDDLWVDSSMAEQHWGYNNFDNFGSAMLTVFQVTTTDGWTPIMFIYENAGSKILSWLYFITCVIICNFFIMNLTVGQILLVYQKQMEDEEIQQCDDHSHRNKTKLDYFKEELEEYAKNKVPKEFASGKKNLIPYIMSVSDIKISKYFMANQGLKINKTLFESFAEAQKQNFDHTSDGPKNLNNEESKNALIARSSPTASEGSVLFEDKESECQLTVIRSNVYTNSEYERKRNLLKNKDKLVSSCMEIIQDVKFNAFILLIIIANTIILCCDKYPNYPDNVLEIFQRFNWLFTFVFTLELIIKVIALGIRPFLKDYFNIFDALIVVASIHEIYISDIRGLGEENKQVLILRTFRCFRIFKFFKVGELKVLVDSQIRTIPMLMPFLTLLIYIFYIFALVGMSFFAGKIKIDSQGYLSEDDADLVREGYDNLGMAMVTIFQVLMGAEWRFIWYQNMTASGPNAAFYYVAIHLLLGTVMINLLIAIMLGNYDKARKFADKRKIFDAIQVLSQGTEWTDNVNLFKADQLEICVLNSTMSKIVEIILDEEYAKPIIEQIINKNDQAHEHSNKVINYLKRKIKWAENVKEIKKNKTQKFDDLDHGHFANSSLGIFHIDGSIRQWCLKLCIDQVNHEELQQIRNNINSKDTSKPLLTKYNGKTTNYNNQFEQVVLLLIIINSIQLAYSAGPLRDTDTKLFSVIQVTNIMFTFIFALEILIKIIGQYLCMFLNFLQLLFIIGLGFYKNQLFHIDAYILSSWNKLDFLIIIMSLIDVFLLISIKLGWVTREGKFGVIKSLRVLRALRPLRAIQRFPALKQVVTAFLDSFLAVKNVFLVYILLLIIFGVIGVSLMKGQFGACDDDSITSQAECPDGQWSVNDSNFDNILQALRTLCIMTTTEGWSGVMYLGVDIAGEGKASVTNNSPFMILYFITFMITGSLYIASLIVSTVIDQYNKAKAKLEKQDCTQDVKIKVTLAVNELNAQKRKSVRYEEPKNWRKHVFHITHHPYFDKFITAMVLANTVTMAMNSYQSKNYQILKLFNLMFTIIFNLEMVLKLISDLDKFFISGWNRLDFLIVVSADISVILDLLGSLGSQPMNQTVIRVFRVLRILRVSKLLRNFHSSQILLSSLFQITQGVNSVLLLLALIIYIYALIGIELFAGAMRLAELDKYNNFDSLGRAVLSLLRYSTGEDFQEFMYEYTNKGSGCYHDGEGEDKFNYATYLREGNVRCGSIFATPFFFSFIVITSWMVINLIIAAIIDGLASATIDQGRLISKDIIEKFLEIWINKYDPDLTWELNMEDDSVWKFLAELPDPLSENQESKLLKKWNPDKDYKDDLSTKYICHFDKEYSKHFKVKKISILKFIRKMDIKFHKRENGMLFVKFDEIAFAWIQRHIIVQNIKQNQLYEITNNNLSKFEKNKMKSAYLAKNARLNWQRLKRMRSEIDTYQNPQCILAKQMIHEYLTQIVKDIKKREKLKGSHQN